MFKITQCVPAALMAIAMAAVVAVPIDMAAAQTMGPMVAVPDNGNSGYTGCYRVQGTIYGPYRMSFCLNRRARSTYTVTGGGLSCNGSLDWYDEGNGNVSIDLYRTPCGRGQQWTGDGMSCRATGWRPLVEGLLGNIKPRVAVPAPIAPINTLNCRYEPVAGGYWPTNIVANRT